MKYESFMRNIVAIRIYYGINSTPMAELVQSDGVHETIQWNDVKQRKRFEPYITAYTMFYDERPKRNFKEW